MTEELVTRYAPGTRHQRALTIERTGIDLEARTAVLAFASEAPYERSWGIEVLDVNDRAVRMHRLQDGAPLLFNHNWDELRRFMWDYVGIVRTNKRLERASHRIALLQGEIQEYYAHFHVTRDLLELRNLVQVADLIVRSAQARHESRGLHFSRDYTSQLDKAVPTTLIPTH